MPASPCRRVWIKMKTAQIIDRVVCCPHCGEKIEVNRGAAGQGSQYAKTWTRITAQVATMSAILLPVNGPCTREELMYIVKRHGYKRSDKSLNARISEMLAVGILRVATPEEKDGIHHTSQAPYYTLDKNRTVQILNRGGKL